MIRTDVDPGGFLKSILHVRDFIIQFKCGESRAMLRNLNLGLGCNAITYIIDPTVKKGNLL